MKPRFIIFLIGGIFFGVGILVGVIGYNILQNAKASLEWPNTEGTVLKSDVVSETSTSGTGRDRRTSTTYKAAILYEYTVEGEKRSSSQVSFGQYSSSDPSHAQKISVKYPVGKKVKVFYSPEEHGKAVLEPGVTFSSYLVLIIGSVFFLIGGGLLTGGIIAGVKSLKNRGNDASEMNV